MPFATLEHCIPDSLIFSDLGGAVTVTRDNGQAHEALRLTAAAVAQCRAIGDANRRIAALKSMPTDTFFDRMCLDVATRASFSARRNAFCSLNRLRRASKNLVTVRSFGEA